MFQVYDINLLTILEFGFTITINLNKYQSKIKNQAKNQYYYLLTDRNFQVVNKLFVLTSEDAND